MDIGTILTFIIIVGIIGLLIFLVVERIVQLTFRKDKILKSKEEYLINLQKQIEEGIQKLNDNAKRIGEKEIQENTKRVKIDVEGFLEFANTDPKKYKLILNDLIKRVKNFEAGTLNAQEMKEQIYYLVSFGLNDWIEEGFGIKIDETN